MVRQNVDLFPPLDVLARLARLPGESDEEARLKIRRLERHFAYVEATLTAGLEWEELEASFYDDARDLEPTERFELGGEG